MEFWMSWNVRRHVEGMLSVLELKLSWNVKPLGINVWNVKWLNAKRGVITAKKKQHCHSSAENLMKYVEIFPNLPSLPSLTYTLSQSSEYLDPEVYIKLKIIETLYKFKIKPILIGWPWNERLITSHMQYTCTFTST